MQKILHAKLSTTRKLLYSLHRSRDEAGWWRTGINDKESSVTLTLMIYFFAYQIPPFVTSLEWGSSFSFTCSRALTLSLAAN